MQNRIFYYLLFITGLALVFPMASLAADKPKLMTGANTAMLVGSCAGCHGTDGNSPGSIPSIAGKSPAFIEQALKEFRDGSRQSTVMGRHAKGYSDKEISLIAEFFSNSK